MEKKTSFLAVSLILLLTTHSQANVEGKLNQKLVDHFPKKLYVVIMPVTVPEKEIAEEIVNIFENQQRNAGMFKKQRIFEIANLENIFRCNYKAFITESFITLKSDVEQCFPEIIFYNNKFSKEKPIIEIDKLSTQTHDELLKENKYDALLVISIAGGMPWFFFQNFLFDYGYTTTITIYDILSGDWAYKLEFDCGWIAKCNITKKDVSWYLRGDLSKKLPDIKVRNK